jgi:hypothetical protein
MSTALAIASVTAVLKDLLNDSIINHQISAQLNSDVVVSALPPDRVDRLNESATNAQSRLNLFLYQVVTNAGWRNAALPSRDGRGERISNPPLALDLHYLLTAYGAEELHAEILLGYGMQLLHETSVLARAAIRRSLAPPTSVIDTGHLPPSLRNLFASELAEQIEQIKIVPQSLSTEEISRMWAAFGAKYRPTAAYQASVVLIESRASTRSSLPVRARNVYVVPFRQPVIDNILSQRQPGDPILAERDQPILAGYRLVIAGQRLRGDFTSVNIGGMGVIPEDTDISDLQIIAPLPAGLPAGVHGVQVIQQRLMGSPPVLHQGDESNLAAFVLHPQITPPITISNSQTAQDGTRSAQVLISASPDIGATQRVVLLLNQLNSMQTSPPGSADPSAYSFVSSNRINLQGSPPSVPPPQPAITIPVSGVRPGDYLVRLQVDGAESPLGVNAASQYDSPVVTI